MVTIQFGFHLPVRYLVRVGMAQVDVCRALGLSVRLDSSDFKDRGC